MRTTTNQGRQHFNQLKQRYLQRYQQMEREQQQAIALANAQQAQYHQGVQAGYGKLHQGISNFAENRKQAQFNKGYNLMQDYLK